MRLFSLTTLLALAPLSYAGEPVSWVHIPDPGGAMPATMPVYGADCGTCEWAWHGTHWVFVEGPSFQCLPSCLCSPPGYIGSGSETARVDCTSAPTVVTGDVPQQMPGKR
jgi:hypothetical protein